MNAEKKEVCTGAILSTKHFGLTLPEPRKVTVPLTHPEPMKMFMDLFARFK